MALQLGDIAPDFEAQTTEGPMRFHQWIGDSWAVLFSHPKDFTPVCTTELGYMAKLKPEFEKRNCKIIGLSADPVTDHANWAKDIQETQGTAPNYPIIGDADLTVSMSLTDYLHVARGEQNAQTALLQRRIRARGDMSYLARLTRILRLPPPAA